MRQHIRVLQCMTSCLPVCSFLDLENMSIYARNFCRNITQMELRLGDGNIDTDFWIALISIRNTLPDLLNLAHKCLHFLSQTRLIDLRRVWRQLKYSLTSALSLYCLRT